MNKIQTFRQYVKDGLIGLGIAFIIFAVLLAIFVGFFKPSTYELLWFIRDLFIFPRTYLSIANGIPNWHVAFSPMPLVLLITFVATGTGGIFLAKVSSRASWIKPIVIIVTCSWLVGIVIWPSLLYIVVRLWNGSSDPLHYSAISPQLFGGIGAIVGLITGFLVGFILNPAKRLFRIIFGAIASTCVAYSIGMGILLEEWGH